MELDELKILWQANEKKQEQSASLNPQLLDKMESQQIHSMLKSLLIKNLVVLLLHLLFIAGLLVFMGYHLAELPYAGSALVLLLFYVYLTVNCIRQIGATRMADTSADIIGKQAALAALNTHMLHYPRLSILCIPVFLSFPVVVMKACIDLHLNYFDGLDMITYSQGKWWTVELIVCAFCVPVGIWFYQQVQPKNMHIKWVKHFIRRTGSSKAYKAAEFLEELQKFKTNN